MPPIVVLERTHLGGLGIMLLLLYSLPYRVALLMALAAFAGTVPLLFSSFDYRFLVVAPMEGAPACPALVSSTLAPVPGVSFHHLVALGLVVEEEEQIAPLVHRRAGLGGAFVNFGSYFEMLVFAVPTVPSVLLQTDVTAS